MKTLVTGAYGFIGHHVVNCLLDDGVEVRAFHLPGEDLANLAGADVEGVPGDITDPVSVRDAVAGCDRVFHLAGLYAMWAPRTRLFWDVNVDGAYNVFRAAADAGVSKVVYTSTIAVTGGQGLDRDATEETPFSLAEAGDPYSATKYAAHKVAESFAAMGLDLTIVSPCGPVGPGDMGPTPTGQLVLRSVQHRVAAVVDTIANLGDVRDIARWHVLAAERGKPGESYLLGGDNVRLADLARLAQRVAFGREGRVVTVPGRVVAAASHLTVGIANRVTHKAPLLTPGAARSGALGGRADCSKARRELGLQVRPLEESVSDALAWWSQNERYKVPRRVGH